MGQHEALIQDIEDQSTRFFKRTDDLKLFLAFVQTSDQDGTRWRSASRDARSLAVICSMAELEALTTYNIQRMHEEFNSCALSVSDLVPTVRQIVAHTTFESLRTLQDPSRVWDRRHFATTLESCIDIALFPIERNHAQPPLDGRTLRPEHFKRLWKIYSLPGIAFPRSSWNASLIKLAHARNDLAHGNLPYHEIFQQAGRSIGDIERYVDDIRSFVRHLSDSLSSYLAGQLYLQS